jgi:hypothetical protein
VDVKKIYVFSGVSTEILRGVMMAIKRGFAAIITNIMDFRIFDADKS